VAPVGVDMLCKKEGVIRWHLKVLATKFLFYLYSTQCQFLCCVHLDIAITIGYPVCLMNADILPVSSHSNYTTTTFVSGLFPGQPDIKKGKPFWILLEQEMMGRQWHQLDHMQIICTSLQTDNHTSTPPLIFLQAGCPSCRPTNSIKALKAATQTSQ